MNASAHNGTSLPNILAAAELIQLPPTTTRLLSLTVSTFESSTIKANPPVAVVPALTAPEVTKTLGVTIDSGTFTLILSGELDGLI